MQIRRVLFLGVVLLLALVVFLPQASALSYTTTLEFAGLATNDFSRSEDWWKGGFVYALDHEVPPPTQVSRWTLDVKFGYQFFDCEDCYQPTVASNGGISIPKAYYLSESFDLGTFAYEGSALDWLHGAIPSSYLGSYFGYKLGPTIGSDPLYGYGIFWAKLGLLDLPDCDWVKFGGQLNITAAPVPEPATLVLLGVGILGIAVAGRRKLMR